MQCVLCQHEQFKTISEKDAKTSETLIVSMCQNCGLIFQNPIPTEQELKSYYSHHYRVDYKSTYAPKPKHVYRAADTAMKRLNFLSKHGIQQGELLDIGAGGGEFTYLAHKNGFNAHGIEPSVGYSRYAQNEYQCDIKTGELGDAKGKYDVVTIFHVMEHLPSPLKAFETLYSLLNTEAYLLVEVPWVETNDASPDNIYFRAHIFYFATATLCACASQYFEVIETDTQENLKVLFRARKVPSELSLPSQSSVDKIKQRMDEKGWMEYFFKGGAYVKPLHRIKKLLVEGRASGMNGKQIIDKYYV